MIAPSCRDLWGAAAGIWRFWQREGLAALRLLPSVAGFCSQSPTERTAAGWAFERGLLGGGPLPGSFCRGYMGNGVQCGRFLLRCGHFGAGNGHIRGWKWPLSGRKWPLLSCIVSGPFRRASEGAGGGQHGQARGSTKKGGCAKMGAPSGGGIRMGLSGVIVGNAPSPASGRQAGEGTCQRIYLMTFLPLTM